MTEAPLSIASSIYFSPLVFFPLMAKKIKFFFTFLLFVETPLMIIFSLSFEIF